MPLLEVSGLSKRYRRGDAFVSAADDVTFSIEPAETFAMVGPSGSGKSTIARLVSRLIEPDAGTILFEGTDLRALKPSALRAMRGRLQIVFQDPLAAFNPHATVGRVIEDPLKIHTRFSRGERRSRVASLLERVRLDPALASRPIHEISGGQRQRVAIARALASSPTLIVLDEAVSALDVSVRAEILQLLKRIQRETRVAYLFITHDLGVVRAMADRVAVLDGGRIVEIGLASEVVSNPQSEIGKALVAAAPRLPRS
ncbi:ABC transporter ATP-binding protein [Tianweitania sp.]|uniref:ABC transporter ATP-binding protein n=1 Tax=Tianweitania sp. TaxID=2021634 RepID=UPI0028A1683C|nr:ATP-binding cassette domain-containing protein [Tianweitania sp.]